MGFFEKIKHAFGKDQTEVQDEKTKKYDQSLTKSRTTFGEKLNRLLANFRTVDDDFFDDLEETLIEADVGFETAVKISDELKQEVKLKNAKSSQEVAETIIQKLIELYERQGKGEDHQLH